MIGLIVSWSIVMAISLTVVDLRPIPKWINRAGQRGVEFLVRGAYRVIEALGGITGEFCNWLIALPYRYRPRTYTHTGRHRRDNPPDPEVDIWPGANDEWVDTLRGMNAMA